MPMTIARSDKTIGQCCSEFNSKLEQFEYAAKFAAGGLAIAENAARLHGKTLSGCSQMSQAIAGARSVVSFTRAVPAFMELVTGRLFFKADSKGNLTEAHSWQTLVIKISLFVARVLVPFLFLHAAGIVDLGVHANWIGLTVIVGFTLVSTTAFLAALQARIDEMEKAGDIDDPETIKERKRLNWDLAVSIGDVVTMTQDNGIINLPDPVTGIINGICLTIGGGIFTARQIFADA